MTGYAGQILHILEPKVGRALAGSVLAKSCGELGFLPEEITPDTLPAVADRLHEPLRVFGGEDFAQELTARIRKISE